MTHKLFIFGFGYTAAAVARRLIPLGWTVAGTTRDASKFSELEADGVTPVAFTDANAVEAALADAGAALITVGTSPEGCPVFGTHGEAIAGVDLKWIGYLSSNGVYGDHDGAWVDEDAELKAVSARGRARIAAERQWLNASDRSIVFRLPGIYGPGRSAIETVRAGRARRIVKPGQVFSRAHVDDIAAVVAASLQRPEAGRIFNVADDEPAPPQDVVTFACELLGVAPPPEEPFETAVLSDMARSFYADNKRIRNDRMKAALGVSLAYPTYREGLAAILAAAG